MALADWALSENRGGYTKEQRKQINNMPKEQQSTYTGLGRQNTGSSTSGGVSYSGGNSGGGGGGGGYYGGTSFDYNGLLAQLRAEQQAAAERLRAEQEAAAREAYERRKAAADEFKSSALAAADESYNYGAGTLNTANDKSLQESYIANMMAKRNLGQNLAYAGKSGGAAESTLLGIENSYGSARGVVEANRQSGLASLANQRTQDRAAAQQQYSQYMMGASDDLNTTLQKIRSDAAAQQAQLLQAQYEAAAKAASEQSSANSRASGSSAAAALNAQDLATEMQKMSYSAYQNLYRQYVSTGMTPAEADQLAQQGAQNNTNAWLWGMTNSGLMDRQQAYDYMR